jgi:acetyl esterase/lipase
MKRGAFFLITLLFSFYLAAQEPAKKPLAIEDFDSWNTLLNPIISADGKMIAFEQNPQRGDGTLILKNGNNEPEIIPRGSRAIFSPENNFLVYTIKPPEEAVRKAKRDHVSRDKMPKDSLGILIFGTETDRYKFSHLKSYRVPEENAQWIAFACEPEMKKDTAKNDEKKKNNGAAGNLVLFNTGTADTIMFHNIHEWAYARKGGALYFSRQTGKGKETVSSLFAFNSSSGKADQFFSEKGWVEKLATDETGEQYAFLFSNDTIKEKIYSLYAGKPGEKPNQIVDSYTPGIPVGWAPSLNGNIYFSDDGTKLYFGTATEPKPKPKDTTLYEDKPRLDIWSWHDEKLQPQQLLEVNSERRRTYLAVYHLNLNRFIQLADPMVKEVSTIQRGNGEVALGYNEHPYLRESGWTGSYNRDYYLVDVKSGIKREIADCKSYVRISPRGRYVIWYDSETSGFFARSTDINKLEAVPLTNLIPVKFYDEEDDRPSNPSPYGIAGWSEDDRFVYIYDRYDIWKIDPAGVRVPVNITKAYGRRNQMRLRYLRLDFDLDYIPSDEDLLLIAFHEPSMANGYFRINFNVPVDPELLVMDRYHFSGVRKAKNADKLIWTRESVSDFPDLWSSNTDFKQARKISTANPHQNQFLWPRVQLVEWNSFSGNSLRGMLYLPENLDPSKKYPMMVYFYERSSENIHRHQHPSPSRSIINIPFYASNGYVVFVPDITYIDGYPGQSAYNAVVSGTQYLVNTFPYIDGKKIGLQGQSWGGYQIAYLITRTNMYAAAMAGAPVSNMTSAYGGIRWQSGLVRMFQYERQQSRIGGSLWEKPLQYIENSPLFSAPKVETPLLMMHNDNDGAVPWYQGIEFFVALRRLDKPVWMLNYNNEPHNLRASSWANRVDLSKRMFQFFNHYLKGHPMPEWMEKGIPALEKGENLGY